MFISAGLESDKETYNCLQKISEEEINCQKPSNNEKPALPLLTEPDANNLIGSLNVKIQLTYLILIKNS